MKKVVLPKILEESLNCKTLQEFYELLTGGNIVITNSSSYYSDPQIKYVVGNRLIPYTKPIERNDLPHSIRIEYSEYYSYDNVKKTSYRDDTAVKPYKCTHPIYYFDESGKIYSTYLSIEPEDGTKYKYAKDYDWYYNRPAYYYDIATMTLVVDKWKEVNHITEVDACYINSENNLFEWYEKTHDEYQIKWFKQYEINYRDGRGCNTMDLCFVMTHPEIELLSKMVINDTVGLPLLTRICSTSTGSVSNTDRQSYERMFKTGTNSKEIFQLPMNFVRALWDETTISVWDAARKMVKLRNCSIDDFIRCQNLHLRSDQWTKIDAILRKKYNEENIFSLNTLLNYIQRIDVNEAIELDEALALIEDTIIMFLQVNQEPNFDTDSLKRTHDLIMRVCKEVRQENTVKGVAEAYNDKYKFEYGNFLIRQIKDYDDLMDEGNQQQNCLRYCYAHRIADKSSVIYVMRKKTSPDKSYISLEIDPTGEFLRQKYGTRNSVISNKSELECIEKWNEFRLKINAQTANLD